MSRAHPAHLAEGPRVGIRPFTYADAAEFTARARESGELHRPWLFPPTTDETYAAYARVLIEDPTKAGCLVYERAGGGIAGFININNIVEGGFRSGALGYGAFAHAAGRGLMGEALALVVRHAFGELRLHRLEINVQPRNTASIALARRAGFRLEGFSPRFLFIDGAWRDHQRWALTTEMTEITERAKTAAGGH
ncbi:GNAT family N-acetyltransferase [Streptomyces flavofungini]|uniref:GNAT family N-acetyltransferase n=1 Tax=Streptomyces flavofungini TaxID=68200 RepID=A0ABS0X519_9ACTN|nr:GNAT family protein [Streptomyces flavofungini]MBJ3808290.1 GNAT family N-acetyltransferase [Streptomyces flavofungini]GHC57655.1 acetyltransferase [Streptomyces flavofungini]